MKKVSTIIVLLYISIILTACVQKEVYITSEVTGYIYSNSTKKPLRSMVGIAGFSSYLTGVDTDIKLDKDGGFTLKPIVEKYYFFKPKINRITTNTAVIFINFEGYKVKFLNLSHGEYKRTPVDQEEAFRQDKKIDVGIIYLEPES